MWMMRAVQDICQWLSYKENDFDLYNLIDYIILIVREFMRERLLKKQHCERI